MRKSSGTYNVCTFKVDIFDKFVDRRVSGTGLPFTPLCVLTSQYTKKSYNFVIGGFDFTAGEGINWDNRERYVEMQIRVCTAKECAEGTGTTNNPLFGNLFFGNENYPYGLYDMTIYENNFGFNTIPANAIGVVYQGIANVSSEEVPEVTYEKYNDNDTDNSSVYITAG